MFFCGGEDFSCGRQIFPRAALAWQIRIDAIAAALRVIFELTEIDLAINGMIPFVELTTFRTDTGDQSLPLDTFYLSVNLRNRAAYFSAAALSPRA